MSSCEARVVLEPPYEGLQPPADTFQHLSGLLWVSVYPLASNTSSYEARVVSKPSYEGLWRPVGAFQHLLRLSSASTQSLARNTSSSFIGVSVCWDRHTKASESHQPPQPPVLRTAAHNPPSGLHTHLLSNCKSVGTAAPAPYPFHERRRRTPAASAPFALTAHPPTPQAPLFCRPHPTSHPCTTDAASWPTALHTTPNTTHKPAVSRVLGFPRPAFRLQHHPHFALTAHPFHQWHGY
ncbi:hypothetical protein GALMADRAFT_435485 [Galerina marginata CBS 339.88]|uniref:Uncharacterized protein n=1 Tax=Galerina marginata (strain CBS 339.88) TaxID=685588 RepID=A0A067T232_GALM3|nr:hypothetical protein GALMADRAFT_435485 [Galerina marginata CBS 339.88]